MTISIGILVFLIVITLLLAIYNFMNSLRIEHFESELFGAKQIIKDLQDRISKLELINQMQEDDGK